MISKKLIYSILMLIFVVQHAHGQRSIYEDFKAHRVGDVITIVLAENINGSSSTDNRAESDRSSGVQATMDGSFIPLSDFDVQTDAAFDANNRATANQRQLLSGNLSVRIEEVMDNGDLFVRGTRSTEINGETHNISFSGFVRPNDVDTQNRVPSFRVANAEIVFQQEGGIEAMKKRKGLFKKIGGAVGVVSGIASIILLGL